MKKAILAMLCLISMVLVFAAVTPASEGENYLDVYKAGDYYAGGVKVSLKNNIFLTGNVEYSSTDKDMQYRLGAIYLVPKEIFIFKFYGGAGYQINDNQGLTGPYIVLGTQYLFLFSEAVYLEDVNNEVEPRFRAGFRFSF